MRRGRAGSAASTLPRPGGPGRIRELEGPLQAQVRVVARVVQEHFAPLLLHEAGIRGKPLPPGWEKKLRSGWIIDDDSWKLFDRVPSTYLPRDHKLPRDTGMYLYGDRFVRVHEPTREVIDTLRIPTIRP